MREKEKMDIIEIVDYDADWPGKYVAERDLLARALPGSVKDIQHVGSTAVPGLGAKPVIDILVAIEDMREAQSIRQVLSSLGYNNIAHDEDAERLFFYKGMPRTHHVHVVKFRSWTYWKHILFRDHLMDHPLITEEYDCLKRVLAKRYREDRTSYLQAKSSFVEMVLERAVKDKLIFFSVWQGR